MSHCQTKLTDLNALAQTPVIHQQARMCRCSLTPAGLHQQAHRVHVLNPDGIHWAIKDEPLPVWAAVTGGISEQDSQEAISPFLAGWILSSIQLPHGDGLGVERKRFDALLIVQSLQNATLLSRGSGLNTVPPTAEGP